MQDQAASAVANVHHVCERRISGIGNNEFCFNVDPDPAIPPDLTDFNLFGILYTDDIVYQAPQVSAVESIKYAVAEIGTQKGLIENQQFPLMNEDRVRSLSRAVFAGIGCPRSVKSLQLDSLSSSIQRERCPKPEKDGKSDPALPF